MANTEQATKRVRQAKKRELQNASERSAVRSVVKKVLKLIQANDATAAKAIFPDTASLIDKAVTHGVIHKNKASRLKSRLHQKLKALSA